MSIGKKIVLGFSLSLLVLLAVALVALLSAWQLQRTTSSLLDSREKRRFAFTALYLMLDAETNLRGFFITGNPVHLGPYREALQKLEEDLVLLRRAVASAPDQLERLNRVEPILRERIALLEVARQAREANAGPESIAQTVRTNGDRSRELMNQVRGGLGEMVKHEDERWARFEAEARENARRSILSLMLGTLLGLLVVGLGSLRLTRGITGPLGKLVTGAEQIGRGHFEHRIDVVNRDETGELARAFNDMAERRQQAAAQLASQARQREHTLQTVTDFVNQLASTSSEILVSTTQQVASAQEQGSAVAETVSTVEEIAQTADEAAGRARSVSESARQSEELGKNGRRVVDEAVASMAAVREQVESIAARILALAEQAQAIGDIITTVNDISEQTHMLALNASIEASRAGEHGRGFSVVAAEVKALADQSKKSTAQVRQILGQIQKATQSAVMTTEAGTQSVSQAARVVSQAGTAIQALGDVLGQVSLTAAQISASANQQATGIGQIRQAMRDVNQATQQTLSSTRQTERAMQDLNDMGQRLKSLLSDHAHA